MANSRITGFSTISSNKSFKLYDDDLIKQDLMNHFRTKKGERILRPDFGCDIHKYIFEQDTDLNRSLILQAATEVFDYHSRVKVLTLKPVRIENGVVIYSSLQNVYNGNIIDFMAKYTDKGVF